MSQQIRVLQCFHCNLFQADISKKSKWQCRICNKKQTVREEYFRGSGVECRVKVQELNMRRVQEENEIFDSLVQPLDENSFGNCTFEKEVYQLSDYSKIAEKSITKTCNPEINLSNGAKKSKWDDYV